MSVEGTLKEKKLKIGYTRFKRIKNYLDVISKNIKVTDFDDMETLRDIDTLFAERLKAVQVLYIVRTISYFGIYFSVISFYISEIFLISELTRILSQAFGFFGTTLFVVTLYFANRLDDLYYQDLNLLAAHAIAIYNKYKLPEGKNRFDGMNEYISFINFFKKRY